MLKLLQFIVDQANLEALEKNKTDGTFVTTAVNTTNLDEETKLLKTLSEIDGPKKVWVKRNTYLSLYLYKYFKSSDFYSFLSLFQFWETDVARWICSVVSSIVHLYLGHFKERSQQIPKRRKKENGRRVKWVKSSLPRQVLGLMCCTSQIMELTNSQLKQA